MTHPLDQHLVSLGEDVHRLYHEDPLFYSTLTLVRTFITLVEQSMHRNGCAEGQVRAVVHDLCFASISPANLSQIQAMKRVVDMEVRGL